MRLQRQRWPSGTIVASWGTDGRITGGARGRAAETGLVERTGAPWTAGGQRSTDARRQAERASDTSRETGAEGD